MAKFTLTPGIDHFTGVATEANEFDFKADTLQATDVITGGGAAFLDVMELTATGTITFGQFAGVSGIDQLKFDVPGSVELSNELVGSGPGLFEVDGSTGADTIDGSHITNGKGLLVFAKDGSDIVTGGNGGDTLVAHTIPNLFAQEHDTLSGGAGNDTIFGEAADTLDGGTGFDVLQVINDFAMNLDLVATGFEYVVSGFGNDIYTAASGSTAVEVYGAGGNDQITGGAGDDNLWGGVGNDTLTGNDGNDLLVGDLGADSLSGGAGNDRLYIDSDDTFIDGGSGFDAAYIATGTGVHLNMATSHLEWVTDFAGGDDVIDGSGVGVNLEIYGGGGNDALTGGSGNDLIFAGSGNDTIVGGAGDDALVGEAGADSLSGGAGNDRLYVDTSDTLIDGGADTDAVYIEGGSGLTINMATSNVEFIQDDVGGNDTINGVGTAMRVFAGGGDDTIGITNSAFTSVSGGGGLDRLALTTAGQSFDVTANVAKITGIEVISMSAATGASLSLTETDVPQITSANSLYVTGGADDSITVGGTGWVLISTTHTNPAISGDTFIQYHNTVTGSELYIADAITGSTINPPNEPPVNTAPAAVTATEDTQFAFTGGDKISVADPDSGVSVTLSVDHGVLNVTGSGSATVGGNGTDTVTVTAASNADVNATLASLTYLGASNFNGNDTLTIVTSDGVANDTDTVAITVNAVNDKPVGADDLAYATAEDSSLVLAVLGNDTDVDGPLPLAVARINGSAVSVGNDVAVTGGSVHVNADGTLTFTPALNFSGAASFNYTPKDGAGLEAAAASNVSIAVTAVNDAPAIAAPASAAPSEDVAFGFTGGNAIAISDVDAASGNVTVTLNVGHGTLSATGAGVTGSGTTSVTIVDTVTNVNTALASLSYTGAANFHGADGLIVSVNDGGNTGAGGAQSASKTVVLNVAPVNDAPAGTAATYTINEDSPLAGSVTGTDVDGDSLSFSLIAGSATNGTATVSSGGAFTFTPTANFNGDASFQFKANDGTVDSPAQTVTIHVTPVNDAPVAAIDSVAVNEDGLAATGLNVLTNDTDIDVGDSKSVVNFTVNGTTHTAGNAIALGNGATLNVSAAGAVTLTQNGAYESLRDGDTASIAFSYTMEDAAHAQSTAGGQVTVNGINDAPTLDLNTHAAGNDFATLETSGGSTAIASDPAVTDGAANAEGQIKSITLHLTAASGGTDAGEALTIPAGVESALESLGIATITGSGTDTLTVTATTFFTPAVAQSLISQITHSDPDTTFAFNAEDRSISVTVTDLNANGNPNASVTQTTIIDMAADVTDLNGAGQLDSFTGANRADIIRGAAGDDTMEGRGGNDTIYGGTELGDAGHDTAVFTGNQADYTVTRTGPGVYTVADSVPGRDGTDTVHDVETLHFNGDASDLLLDAPIQVFDATNTVLLASFAANQLDLAVNYANTHAGANVIELQSSASPFTATAWPLDITEAVTVKAVGGTATVNASSHSAFQIEPGAVLGAGDTVRLEGLNITGNGTTGDTVGVFFNGAYEGPSDGAIALVNTAVSGFGSNGVAIIGGGAGLTVTIDGDNPNLAGTQTSTFTGSGYSSTSGGSGDILFFAFTGAAALMNLSVVGTTGITAGSADNGIQFAGFDGADHSVDHAIGSVSFQDAAVSGTYEKTLVYVQGYDNLSGLSFADGLTLGGAGSQTTWAALFIDGGPQGGGYVNDGTSTLDLSGVAVGGGSYGTSPSFVALGSKPIVVNGVLTGDVITGTSAAEAFIGSTGDDTINAGGGADLVLYNVGDGHDTIDGEGGTDTLGLINFSAGAPSATPASFAITESGGHLVVQTDGAGAAEVDAAGMESLQLILGNGGDTVTLSGNIAGAGIATGAGGIVGIGGIGGDTLDASGLTSTSAITFSNLGGGNDTFKAANVAANDTVDGGSGSGDTLDYAAASAAVTIDLSAGTASGTSVGSDTVANYENAIGGAGGDGIAGTAGANTLSGNGGDDTLTGRGGADTLTGGETGETHGDVASYSQVVTAGMIAPNGSGGWTVTTGGAEGTDTLSEIEVVQGADPAGLATGKFLLVGNGGYATYDAAYAEAVDGDTIVLAAGTYGGDHVVGKAISIVGANYNVSGAGPRGAESVLTGHWTVNAAGPVTIDGVEFLNNTPWVSGTNDTRLTLATGADVEHSVFYNTRPGGNKPISDIAINVTATTGTVSILDNRFTGDFHGKYFNGNLAAGSADSASWGGGTTVAGNAGAIVWGGGSTLNASSNTIEYARTAVNLTGDDALVTLNADHFVTSGTAITATGWSGAVTSLTNSTFTDVDNEINDRFEAAGVSINLSSNTSDNWFSYLGGIGGDTITGTAGKDAILANQGNDTVHTLQGNDSIFVNVNTGNDIVDGGSETLGKDTLIISNVGISGGSGNALDPGDAGDPATSNSGNPSATKVTYTMTPDSANTVHPTDGTDSADDISVTMATTAGATPLGSVTADEIEDVQFNLGSGGDTVNISGDFTNTSLSGSTIKVVGGNGADTVDARSLSSTHAINFAGNGGDDYFYVSGAGGNDTFDGGSGINTIDYSDVGHGVTVDLGNGAAQNTGDGSDTITNVQNVVGTAFGDTLTGTAGANRITGGGGVDTSGYGATLSTAATFGFDGSGHWTVTIGGATDTLIGVERLTFSDKTVLLVDQSGANVGGFQHVQDAIDFASGGETILIKGGLTYSESHTTASGPAGIYIDKPGLTLQGVTAAGALITDVATAQNSGPTIVSAHQNNFGANHWVDVNGDNTTFSGVHLKAGAETDNKVLEFWANNVTVQNSFVDVYKTVAGPSEVYTFATAIYINDNGTTASDEITAYTIDGNILNEGIIVANGVGDPSLGIAASQKITDNAFIDTFDYNTGLGRYDTVVINGQVNGIGWLLEPTQTPTITGNTVANNTVPFLLRGSDNSAANLPSAAQIAVILANNFDANVSYAYVVDSTTGALVLATRDDGAGPYHSFAVTNSIDTLNLALDTSPDNVFGGQRDYIHAGDTVIVQSGAGAPVDSQIMVDNLKVMATANSADLDLTLATQYADGSAIPAGGVHNITLTDYAVGSGANVDVAGNALDNVIVGNSRNNSLDGGAGDDTLTGGKGADTLTGGTNSAVGDTVDYSKETGANGVTVDLGANTATDTFGNTDTLSGIENAIGTAHADTLTGSAGANVFTGKGGADTIHGGGGSDAARFGGNQSDYTITWNGTTATVTDNRGGSPDGTDTVDSVGELRFADHSVWLVGQPAGNDFTTIQSAVNAAHSGDTVMVANGTYLEQVTVAGAGKNGLTIIGESEAGVIVKAPAALVSNGVAPSNGRNVDGMITVDDADGVTITKLTVDGDTKGNLVVGASNPTMVGIAYLNSDDGVIDDVTVVHVREPDGSFGVQRNVGIFVSNSNPSGAAPTTPSALEAAALNSIEIKNTTVADFQKGGIVVSFADASIHDNTVTGHGLTGLTAQNGIQVAGSTGSIVNNTVTGIGYNNTAVAIGYAILTFNNRDVAINGNHVTGTGVGDSSGGIAAIGSTGVVVTNNDLHQVIDAIDVYATAGFVDALAPSAASNPGGAFDFSSNAVDADIPFSVFFQPFAASTDAFNVTGTSRDDEIYGASVGDTLAGGDGNDILAGRGGADTMLGGAGNDTLVWTAGDGNDTSIDGGANSDTLELHDTAGSDTIQVVTNGTTITGLGGGTANVTNIETVTLDATHGGTDTLDYTGTTVAVTVNLATDSATGFNSITGAIENVTGGAGGDTLTGSAGANTIVGAAGNDTITGAGGDDQLSGGADSDTFNYTVGDGHDTVDGGATGSDVDTQNVNGTAATETFNINPISGGYLGINIESGISAVAATDANFEVRTIEVEEINVVTNGGGDSVIISGDLGGTGVASSTVHVTGDSGDNSFDASGISGATPVRVVFDGAGGADTLTGGAANDILIGGDGADTIKGGGGNDTIYGGTATSDSSATDKAIFSGSSATYTITFDPFAAGGADGIDVTVTGGADGDDTLHGVELLQFGNGTIDLTKGVLLFDSADHLVGTFDHVQDAVNAADNSGETIKVRSGSYHETVTIGAGKDGLSIEGANFGMDGAGPRGTESSIDAFFVSAAGVTIDGVKVNGVANNNGEQAGVMIGEAADGFTLTNSVVDRNPSLPSDFSLGFTTIYGQQNDGLTLTSNSFSGWDAGAYLQGGATLSDATVTGNTFSGNSLISDADLDPASTVSGNTFTGGAGIGYGSAESENVGAVIGLNSFDTAPGVEIDYYVGANGQSDSGTVNADQMLGTIYWNPGTANLDQTFQGGAGADLIYGGGGVDTAQYAATITAASISTASVNVPAYILDGSGVASSVAGWQVAAGAGEGTDSLVGVEVVHGAAAGNFLLVGNGGFAQIAQLFDGNLANGEAAAGDTILVAAGSYNPFTVNRDNITIKGVQPGVVVHGTFQSDNGNIADGGVAAFLKSGAPYSQAAGSGITVGANNLHIDNLTVDAFTYGLNLGDNTSGTSVSNVAFTDNLVGIKKGTTADITGFSLTSSSITDGLIGIDFDKDVTDATPAHKNNGLADGVTIDGVSFTDLVYKGAYFEALSNAHLTNITMDNVAQYGAPATSGTAGSGGNGIDLNLKNGDYGNVEIDHFTLNNVGASDRDGADAAGHQNGGAIVLEARDQGSYLSVPATFTGAISVHDGTISGHTSTGIQVGEPNQNNADPDVTVTAVSITGEQQTALPNGHGDVANVTQSTLTVTMLDGGDSLIASPTTTGTMVVNGGTGADTITTGGGADTIDAGAGSDTVTAGSGNDTVIGTADGVADSYSGGSGTDTIDYAALTASQAISLNLGTGLASGSAIGTDTLSGFENANGGAGNDSLFGSNANNVIHGGGGTDNIVGSGGADQLFGDAGSDTLNGGVNDFALTPAAANDVLWGGADTDTFRFEGRFGDDSIGTVGHADWSDGEDMVFVGYASQTPIIADVTGGVLISIDDGSVASSVFVAGATSALMQQLISRSDLIIH
ncbi:MAG: tandem-95 repeat protein [Alphaproteobacteria bacterium]|nr:MAG: tandem-95 repeat protein [Alphaproteobacteria bacterium]